MSNYQLIKKVIIKGKIEAKTGLLIGGSNSALEIGGIDKYVIRNPINDMPYIPGSSLKGKMRSLLELNTGKISFDKGKYGPTHNPNHLAAQLFGFIKHKDNEKEKDENRQRASRVIVRDGELMNASDFENRTDLLHTEIKTENTINRITSEANPRSFERVPKGAIFNLEIIINIFSGDNEDEFYKGIFGAINLLEDDYLGGGGSRGNGQISFDITKMEQRTANYYTGTQTEEEKKEADLFHLVPAELKKTQTNA